jgi:WD40-like Beta Propeller Repeat
MRTFERRAALPGLVILMATLMGAPGALAAPGITTRVSVDSSGAQGNGESDLPAISADGRFVAFHSAATNLVAGDTNGFIDVFVHDRQTGITTRVSVDSSGSQGNGVSASPAISADGRFVAFHSTASNLVSADTNADLDVFVHDRETGITTRVSVDSSGAQGNATSGGPIISADGRFVAFQSFASNLVVGDTNFTGDVFIHDRTAEITTRVSVDSSGAEGNGSSGGGHISISADGRFVAFRSFASNLVAGDTNGFLDVFVHDRETGVTTRVSVDSSGAQGNEESEMPSISADGRFVAFHSLGSNLVAGDTNGFFDVFLHDRETGVTSRVSVDSSGLQGDNGSNNPSISADGRFVAFESDATNFVAGDTNFTTDVFVYEPATGGTGRVSVNSSGADGNDGSILPAISADGGLVAFESFASNLVAGDTNFSPDVFVHERGPHDLSLGLLRVTTSPAVPSQILVNGVPRDTWGLNWVKLPPGTYTVSFTHVEGYTEPDPQTVNVTAGNTTTADGTFTQRGTLRVTTNPAVAGTISVDGIPRDDWGVWTDLPTGSHQVCFGAVEGFDPPPCQNIILTAGQQTTLSGDYTANPSAPGPTNVGMLRVTTSPAVPSQILVDGVPYDTWGLNWVKVPPGSHTVSFTHVEGYTEPNPQTVNVTAGNTTTVDGTFTQRGTLRVTTNPAVAGTISVDGIPRDDWGVWTDLPTGSHQVCFGAVQGFTAPPCQNITLTAGQQTTVTGTYT